MANISIALSPILNISGVSNVTIPAHNDEHGEVEKQGMLEGAVTSWLAFACTWLSNIVCVYLIVQHVRNYTQPGFQRYICRIIFIVPFYCTGSWLALKYRDQSIYYETPRDCYEAWVIYNFMSLCMAYVGGPGAVVVRSEGKLIQPSWILCTCCMKPIPVDGFFLRNCKQGTLQFVIAKPILSLMTLILFSMDLYQVGDWSINNGYFYVALIYNLCYTLALFWMLLFYVGTEELLHPFKPLLKFFVFKAVIFLTFWQGLVVTFLATRFSWTPDDAEALQNWLICVEMAFAAVGMFFAFPVAEYQLGGAASPGWKWDALKHAISIRDVIDDIIFQFNPDYKAYVLHTDGGPSENVKRKKFRGKKKKKPAFTMIQKELGNLGSKITKMTKLKPNDRRRVMNEEGTLENEEGGQWHSATRPHSVLHDLRGGLQTMIEKPAQKLSIWMPAITEAERGQAELLDSDSDAGYDEENQQECNQLDHAMLATSSSGDDDDDDVHVRGRRRSSSGESDAAGRGFGLRGSVRLRVQSDSDDERWSNQRQSNSRKKKIKDPAQDDSWARFPGSFTFARTEGPQDSSWADFDSAGAQQGLGDASPGMGLFSEARRDGHASGTGGDAAQQADNAGLQLVVIQGEYALDDGHAVTNEQAVQPHVIGSSPPAAAAAAAGSMAAAEHADNAQQQAGATNHDRHKNMA